MVLRKFHIIFILIALTTSYSYGQVGADFSVVSEAGCDAFTVSVIDQSGADSLRVVVYNYGDGGGETSDTFHVYTSPGIYKIVQTVAQATPRHDSVFIEVIEPRPPEYILSNCKGTEAFVYVTDTLYNAYWVDWGDGNSEKLLSGQLLSHDYGVLNTFNVTVKGLMDEVLNENDPANLNCSSDTKTITLVNDIVEGTIDAVEVLDESSIRLSYTIDPGTAYFLESSLNGPDDFSSLEIISSSNFPGEYVVTGLSTTENFYCFRLTAFDPCDGTNEPSSLACSVLLDVAAENNQNQLTWLTETADLNGYDVFKDGTYLSTTLTANYADPLVECGIVYCYRITLNENNGLVSISNQKCDTAFSNDTPAPLDNVSASVENDQIVLSWEEVFPAPAVYQILRVENGDSYSEINVTENSYVDSVADPNRHRYYYGILYEDRCGNESPAALASPVLLSNTSATVLNWNQYVGWQNGPRTYVLEKYSADGEIIGTEDVGLDTLYEENGLGNLPQQVIYRIVALPADADLPHVNSNFLELTFPSYVVFPNAFTPNGDGLNDTFNFMGRYVSNYRLTVFTRWGELIFETRELDQGWDGTYGAKPVPSGVYIFHAEFEDEMGVPFSKKGEIYLLR